MKWSKLYFDEYAKNFRIAYPVALSQLGHISVGVADTIMAGTLGGVALAAATIATSVYIPLLMLGIGLSFGATALVAQANGEGNRNKIVELLKSSVVLNLFLGIGLTVLTYFSPLLFPYLDQPEEVSRGAKPFIEIISFSMLPLMLFQAIKQHAEGLGITRPSMFISISANVVNILLIFVLKDGYFGIPPLGLNGIAWATLLARFYMFGAMALYLIYHQDLRLQWKDALKIKAAAEDMKKLLAVSVPIGLQMVFESGSFGFAAIMIGWLGSNEVSAHQIALNMAAVTYMAATGIAAAATVRVGFEYGKGNFVRSRIAGFAALHVVLVFMTLMSLLIILFRHQLPFIYIDDPQIVEITARLLLIAAIFQLADGAQVVGLGSLRGMSDVKVPTSLVLMAYWGIGLPIGYLLAFPMGMGTDGVWWGLCIGLLLVSLFLVFRFHLKTKRLTQ